MAKTSVAKNSGAKTSVKSSKESSSDSDSVAEKPQHEKTAAEIMDEEEARSLQVRAEELLIAERAERMRLEIVNRKLDDAESNNMYRILWPQMVGAVDLYWLTLAPKLVWWRNFMIITMMCYIFLCVLLMTVIYSARKSASILIFNTIQSVSTLVGLYGMLAMNYPLMLTSISMLVAVWFVIMAFISMQSYISQDSGYLVLHASMLIVMDLPFIILCIKANKIFYREFYAAEAEPDDEIHDQTELAAGISAADRDTRRGANRRAADVRRKKHELVQELKRAAVASSSSSSGSSSSDDDQKKPKKPAKKPPVKTGVDLLTPLELEMKREKQALAKEQDEKDIQGIVPSKQEKKVEAAPKQEKKVEAAPNWWSESEDENGTVVKRPSRNRMSQIQTADLETGDNICPICMSNGRDYACVPCGHMLCGECGRRLNEDFPSINELKRESCPICRGNVTQYVKLFV